MDIGKSILIKDFLEKCKRYEFKITKPQSKTFMQVTGYPHFENVCSNILAFFLDTNEVHGFDDLFLRALLSTYYKEIHSSVSNTNKYPISSIEIMREFITNKGGRLDIFIESDQYVIGIENKIFHNTENNDFEDYSNTINRKNIEGKTAINILLTLDDETNNANYEFVNVRYVKLFSEIKSLLGEYILKADATWAIFLKDFMNTIVSLKEEIVMDTDLARFFVENDNEIEIYNKMFTTLQKQLRAEALSILAMVDVEGYNVEKRHWNPKTLESSCYFHINNKKGYLDLEVLFNPQGVHIIIQSRVNNDTPEKLKEFLLNNDLLEQDNPYSYNEEYFTIRFYRYSDYEKSKIVDEFNIILKDIMDGYIKE